MLTVNEVKKNIDKVRFGKTKLKLVEYLEADENQDKVFTGMDISEAFPGFSSCTIINYLRALVKDGAIGKIKLDTEVYYGGKKTSNVIERFRMDRTTMDGGKNVEH